MRSYLPEKLAELEDPATLQRLKPLLSDAFDVISLDRPGFLAELGLLESDESWLRAGAQFQSWLYTPVLPRALAEEASSAKLTNEEFLTRCLGLIGEALWRQGERLFLRCERLLTHPEASRAAQELGLKLTDFEALRTRWKTQGNLDQQVLDGLMLQLRGVGQAPSLLEKRMEQQREKRFLWFFRIQRPVLTKVSDDEIELTTALTLAGKTFSVSASFAREVGENSKLSPELWARQWGDYLNKRSRVTTEEFRAMLEHFEEGERYKAPNLVALHRAKARRAVAAVAFMALERLESADDTASLERLWKMVPDFSERYDLQQVLKKRFGLGL